MPRPGEIANGLLRNAAIRGEVSTDTDFSQLRKNFTQAIEKTHSELTRQSQVDDIDEASFTETNEDEYMNAMEKFSEYVPLLEEAYDEKKEEILALISKLYAKRQVLDQEMKQTRFSTPKGKLSAEAKNDMLSYAGAIALYRLQVEDM